MAALPTGSQVTGVANTLLRQAGVPRTVHGIEQCGSVLFGQLYEALTGARPPAEGESEAERCQAVVDAFSRQLAPHVSLEHIRGRDLASRDPLSILHLLDIFSVLFHMPTVRRREMKSPLVTTRANISSSTDSTAELLCPPLPHTHRPHLSPDLTPSPSLTITSLTHSTVDQSQTTATPSGESAAIPSEPPSRRPHRPTETLVTTPLTPPTSQHVTTPLTPPPSQRQLLKSPLHQSTPRPQPTHSRIQPPPTSVTLYPLTTTTAATAPARPTSHSLVLTSSDEDNDCNQRDETTTSVDMGEKHGVVEIPDPIPDPEPGNETKEISEAESEVMTSVPQPEREEAVAERQLLLKSLCQRYLREIESGKPPTASMAARPGAARSSPAAHAGLVSRKAGVRPAGRRSDRHSHRPRGRQRQNVKNRDRPKFGVTSDLFPVVEESLPVCPVSMETIRHLWGKQLQQITSITKPTPSHHHRTANQKIEAMARKQEALLESLRKEIDHTQRMRQQEERQAQQRAVKSQLEARRQATARARCYFRDYELDLKAKLQKKRTNEELVFRRVFEDGLALLREREREVRRVAREKCQQQRERLGQELEAMEQYYSDQFSMLAEGLVRERKQAAVREKAKTQLSRQLGRELRERLEKEVKELQSCLDRDDDVTHFRELDAQQLRLALHHLLTPSL